MSLQPPVDPRNDIRRLRDIRGGKHHYIIFASIPLEQLATQCQVPGCRWTIYGRRLSARHCLAHRLKQQHFPRKSPAFAGLQRQLNAKRSVAKFAVFMRSRHPRAV